MSLKRLGGPLRIRQVLAGAGLFEIGVVAVVAAYVAMSGAEPGDEPEAAGLGQVFLVTVFALSAVLSSVGFVAAEASSHMSSWKARSAACVLAGAVFGIGWSIPVGLGYLVSRMFPALGVVNAVFFWGYLVLGPVSLIPLAARLVTRGIKWRLSHAG